MGERRAHRPEKVGKEERKRKKKVEKLTGVKIYARIKSRRMWRQREPYP